MFTSLGFVGPWNQKCLTIVLTFHNTNYYISRSLWEAMTKLKGPVRPRGRIIIREIIIREIITPLEVESENKIFWESSTKACRNYRWMHRPTHPGWMLGLSPIPVETWCFWSHLDVFMMSFSRHLDRCWVKEDEQINSLPFRNSKTTFHLGNRLTFGCDNNRSSL